MNLKEDVLKYQQYGRHHLENVKVYYGALKLEEAVCHAALGQYKDDQGNYRLDPHQRRVGNRVCQYAQSIISSPNYLPRIKSCTTFDDLYAITEEVAKQVFRAGPLWAYDTALRIGFSMKIYPDVVYIHAGVKTGTRKLLHHHYKNSRTLALNTYPKELWVLKPYEAENFLCIWGKE